MTVTWEAVAALVAVAVFAVDAYLHRSLTALGLIFLALCLMLHAGVRVG